METKTIISIIVALVVVGGGVWYMTSHHQLTMPAGEATTTGENQEGSGTLADLMMRSGSYKCTVEMKPTADNQNAQSSGTVYIGNGKMRGDFNTVVAAMGNKTVESHMISSDGYVYTWSNLMPQGMKMQVATNDGAATQGGLDASAAVDYHCAPWMVQDSQFVLPTNVTFTAVGQAQ